MSEVKSITLPSETQLLIKDATARKNISSLNTTVDSHTTSIGSLSNSISSHALSINSLVSTTNSHSTSISELTTSIGKIQKQIGSYKIEILSQSDYDSKTKDSNTLYFII